MAGIVLGPARVDGGPSAGARIVARIPGPCWAERAAVPLSGEVPIPASVDFETAAALPVSGLTAYRVLTLGGLLLGKKVRVT